MPSQTSLSAQPSKLLFGDRQRERRMTTQPNPFISREGATKPNPAPETEHSRSLCRSLSLPLAPRAQASPLTRRQGGWWVGRIVSRGRASLRPAAKDGRSQGRSQRMRRYGSVIRFAFLPSPPHFSFGNHQTEQAQFADWLSFIVRWARLKTREVCH